MEPKVKWFLVSLNKDADIKPFCLSTFVFATLSIGSLRAQ